jgi:hypothetical protein
MVHPGVQIKAVEGNTLFTDLNFKKIRTNFSVKAVAVHAQVEGRVPQPDQPWCDGVMASRDFTHVCPRARAKARVVNMRWKTLVVSQVYLASVRPDGMVRTTLLS